jgi:hypothetical protein
MAFLEWLQSTWITDAVIKYGPVYPAMESLHYVGLGLLVGALMLIDLRLLGVAKRLPLASMITLLPWVWVGFCINAVTGGTMFIYNATGFGVNKAFWLKMTLILLAGINALVFEIIARRGRTTWVASGHAPAVAKTVATLSLLLWVGVVTAGRWMAYV